ncbi:unnamed protein product [Diatraea saccharalis]|uniref:Uncharacterized protein n=1 Tax=Diatraea saccharalis TaxID=40085 RepID=A0A9N9R3N0_9NEOP|nr:unnamed protein product [Diatraea saccharalis]
MSGHYLAYLNINDTISELYDSIVNGNYSYAVKLTQNLSVKNGFAITNVIEKLTQEVNSNLLSYGYKLWSSGERDIVHNYLPHSFSLIFNEGNNVVLINRRYDLALKLDAGKDSNGDRKVWGDSSDKTSRRIVWQMLPIWYNNKVYFKLKNWDCNQFLKMGLYPDDIKDRPVYGDTKHDEMRHTWYLEPVLLGDIRSFFITNRQFSQRLKLAVSADSIGDRQLWGHNGDINKNDLSRFLWDIKKH